MLVIEAQWLGGQEAYRVFGHPSFPAFQPQKRLLTLNGLPTAVRQHFSRAVGQVAPQALPDNLRLAPDKGFCQGTRFARTLTY